MGSKVWLQGTLSSLTVNGYILTDTYGHKTLSNLQPIVSMAIQTYVNCVTGFIVS